MRLVIALLVAGCASQGSQEPAGMTPEEPRGPVEEGTTCVVSFAFAGDATSVGIAGEWGWAVPVPATRTEAGWQAELELVPGRYAYKWVVERDGRQQWLLDPAEPRRKYVDGVENSMRIVEDCRAPSLVLASKTIQGHSATFRMDVTAGYARDVDAVSARLRHNFTERDVPVADGVVSLSGLAPGKYTLVVSATGNDGRTGDIRLPFWIEDEAFSWEGAIIYMTMVDRFINGDPSNDGSAEGAEPTASFFGGDIRGITQAIEAGELTNLGVGAIWLSPIPENTTNLDLDGDGVWISAYHGYWPIQARKVDPRFGTTADLEAMVKAAHERGIRVLLDYVVNHVHEGHEYFASNPEWFRTGCKCGTPGCGWTEKRLSCLFTLALPDVNWATDASAQMVEDAVWWLDRFDLDGLRVDAVKHVEDAAVTNLSAAVAHEFEQAGTEYFLLGETAMGWNGHSVESNRSEYDTISRYIGEFALNGQFDFVLHHATAYRVWANGEFGMPHLDFWTRASLKEYPAAAIMTPFLGSHDSTRFMTLVDRTSYDSVAHHKWPWQGLPGEPEAAAYDRVAQAFVWLFSVPGAPLLYYGDEYGEYGGADPDNRHMWRPHDQRTAAERDLYSVISRAGRARAGSEALRKGGYMPLHVTEDTLVFARHTSGSTAIAAFNTSGADIQLGLDLPASLTVPAAWTDALGSQSVPGGSRLELVIPAGGSRLLTM